MIVRLLRLYVAVRAEQVCGGIYLVTYQGAESLKVRIRAEKFWRRQLKKPRMTD